MLKQHYQTGLGFLHTIFFFMGVSAHFGLLEFLLRSALKFTHLKLILFYYEKKNYNRKEKRPKVFMVLNLCKIQVCLSVYLFNFFFFNSASASASYNSKKKKRKLICSHQSHQKFFDLLLSLIYNSR